METAALFFLASGRVTPLRCVRYPTHPAILAVPIPRWCVRRIGPGDSCCSSLWGSRLPLCLCRGGWHGAPPPFRPLRRRSLRSACLLLLARSFSPLLRYSLQMRWAFLAPRSLARSLSWRSSLVLLILHRIFRASVAHLILLQRVVCRAPPGLPPPRLHVNRCIPGGRVLSRAPRPGPCQLPCWASS